MGKTSWIKSQLGDILYFDLLDTSTYSQLLSDPSTLEKIIPPGFTNWIVIDEIQKVPALLDEVHRLIETYQYRFVLTGSSARSLRKYGVNLLAGGAFQYHMYPLTCYELKEEFTVNKALKFGLLPTIYDSDDDPTHYLESYIGTYIREEVMQILHEVRRVFEIEVRRVFEIEDDSSHSEDLHRQKNAICSRLQKAVLEFNESMGYRFSK